MLKKHIVRLVILVGIICSYFAILRYQDIRIETEMTVNPFQKHQNTTVYAAYSSDGTVPDYVVENLRLLKEVSPNIVYITDNPIRRGDIGKIKHYITHLIALRHGEYDWGSYKRGYNWLKTNNYLTLADKLILANDSVLTVVPSLTPIFDKMSQDEADYWGITANKDGTYHLQSYFLVFRPKVYNHKGFANYLNNVKKQSTGLEVAYHYEVPFTTYLHALGYKSAAYIPYKDIKGLELNDKHCYPLTMLSKYHQPFLKMRTFTNRLIVKEPRRLVFAWLKKNNPTAYQNLITHLTHIKSPYLEENK